jgi:hypothetical protein
MKTLEQIRIEIKQKEADVKNIVPPQHLSNKDKTRHKRLLRLLAAIESGQSVANRELRTALTDDEWDDFIARREHIKEARQEKMPDVLKDYIEKLKKADFLYMRARNTKTTKRSRRDINGNTGATRLEYKAESLYEDALIKLEEMFDGRYKEIEGELTTWFDRDIDLTHGSLLGADPSNIPRINVSKSQHCLTKGYKKHENEFEQRRDTKKDMVIQSLKTLLGIDETTNNENANKHTTGNAKLRELLQNDDDDII